MTNYNNKIAAPCGHCDGGILPPFDSRRHFRIAELKLLSKNAMRYRRSEMKSMRYQHKDANAFSMKCAIYFINFALVGIFGLPIVKVTLTYNRVRGAVTNAVT